MTYLMQKSRVMKVAGVVLILLLPACIADQQYTHHVNDNKKYLKAPSLYALSSPSNMILPVQNDKYEIPVVTHNGAVGTMLDIYPPKQILTLPEGSHLKYSSNKTSFQLENNK